MLMPKQKGSMLRSTVSWMTSPNRIAPVAFFLVLMAAWQFLPGALHVKPFIFPELDDVLRVFTSKERLELIFSNLKVTLIEAMAGLAIAIVLGVTIGFILGTNAFARRLIFPYLIAIQGLPKVAVAPLLLVWLGFGSSPKVILAALLCFFPMLINTMSGVSGIDPARVELFKSIKASRWQYCRRLLFPTALPSIFAAIELVSVFATLGAIVAELVSATSGIAVVLQTMETQYDTAGMFAVFMVLALMGVLINQTVRFIRRRVISWEG